MAVPKDYLGAHVLMGGVNMVELLEPPFTKENISRFMVGFQRALVGPGRTDQLHAAKNGIISIT